MGKPRQRCTSYSDGTQLRFSSSRGGAVFAKQQSVQCLSVVARVCDAKNPMVRMRWGCVGRFERSLSSMIIRDLKNDVAICTALLARAYTRACYDWCHQRVKLFIKRRTAPVLNLLPPCSREHTFTLLPQTREHIHQPNAPTTWIPEC